MLELIGAALFPRHTQAQELPMKVVLLGDAGSRKFLKRS
jgi:hypothetical protein